MTLTFVDAGVLIAAVRGTEGTAQAALRILDDPDRKFASSAFVRLEVLPKAIYYRNDLEAEFYETFFDAVTHWAGPPERIVEEAFDLARAAGLSALDAMHVAAAAIIGVDEFVTTVKAEKPIHRTRAVSVRSIHPGP